MNAFAVLALLSGASPVSAAECQCVTKGQRVDLGTVICLEVSPSVRYLARCERVLNNTSWRKLGDGCPSAGLCLPEPARHQSFRTG
ncbi:hypothetical protein E2A64_08940 [Pseudohoeflea suaedae]|uniref:Uncharacterized protein n=1 Tax=Pseudohoeflea suaedae TaxID=877384 RepID=A0A4R5PQF1_9HYPH|nr:hypothetical protein [Pseudohoeflea suaedae]TDH39178.1 hypothetical protein E2A64_08940 [Pseudohoeflea suaedae]